MADNGLGFSLEIPDKFLKDAAKADLAIEQLAKRSEDSSARIVTAFKQMSDMGVQPFLDKLEAANKQMGSKNLATFASGMLSIGSETENATSKITLLINKINQIDGSKIGGFGDSGKNIAELTKEIEKIDKVLKDSKSGLGESAQQDLVNTRERYKLELREQQKSEEAKIAAKNKRIEAETKASEKVAEVEAKNNNTRSNNLAKEVAEYEKAQNKKKELQAKAEEELRKFAEDRIKKEEQAAKQQQANSEKLAKVEQARIENIAKQEEANRKEKAATNEKMLRDTERVTKELDKQAETQRKLNQAQAEESRKAQLGTYGGAMDSSRDATTMAQRISAINNLKRARQDLSTTDVDYNNKLNALNKAILFNEQANKKAVEGSKELNKSHSSVMNTSDQLTRKLALIFSVSQIQGYVANMIKVRGEFELQNRALQAILQNKDEADKLFGRITELAVRSPFQVKELVTYTKQLSAYRIETEKLYDTTKMLADVSAGLGVDMFRLILAYGQVKAANYLRGTELRQFSEAGINILGELATYYTELEGKMVSVGDVQERVTKRMVAFGDVEEVFKRITSAGSIFYNMQEIQAETLSGQMSNLRDSIDIMFNSIGKANDANLKNAVGTVRELVENWREIAFVLKQVIVAFAAYKGAVTLASIGNSTFTKSVFSAYSNLWIYSKAMVQARDNTVRGSIANGLWAKSLTGIKTGAIALGKGLASIIGAAAPVLLIGGMFELYRQMTAASRAAEVLRNNLNGIIGEDTSNLDKEVDGYDTLISRLKLANDGSKERKDIIEAIKSGYGQYLNFIVDEKTSIEQLTAAYDDVVKSMKAKAAASTLEKGYMAIEESYASDITEARQELEKELSKGITVEGRPFIPTKQEIQDIFNLIQAGVANVDASLLQTSAEQRNFIQSIVQDYIGQGAVLSQDYTQLVGVVSLAVTKKEQELELEKNINSAYKETLKSRQANIELWQLENKLATDKKNINKTSGLSDFDRTKELKKIQEQFELEKIELKFKFGEISEAEKNKQRDSIINWATATVSSINEKIKSDPIILSFGEEKMASLLINKAEQESGISATIENTISGYKTQTSIIDEQLRLKDAGLKIDEAILSNALTQQSLYERRAEILGIELNAIKKINEATVESVNAQLPEEYWISIVDQQKSLETVISETNKKYNDAARTIELLNHQKTIGLIISEDDLKKAEEAAKYYKETLRLLEPDKKKTTSSSKEDPMKARISIIKEAGKAYEEYLKYYDKETAKLKTQKAYKDAFKEAEIEDMTYSMDFDVSGVIAGLETLLKSAVGKTRKVIEKEIADLKTKVDIEVEVKNLELLQRQVDDIFSGYEFSLELEKTGMGSDLMKQIFNVDTLNLDDVRKKIEELYPDTSKLGTEELKEYEKALRRLSELEEKQIKDQAKKYAQYLIKSKDERIAIKEDELRQIAEMEKLDKFTPEQKEQIKTKIQKESTQKIAKVDYEDLKATDLYKKSFEDLERLGTTSLNLMLVELQRFAKESGQALDPASFKELTNNIKNMRDEVESRNPFSSLVEGIAEYKQSLEDLKIAQAEYDAAQAEAAIAQEGKKAAEVQVEQAQIAVTEAPEEKRYEAVAKLWVAQTNLTAATNTATAADNKKAAASKKVAKAEDDQADALTKVQRAISKSKNNFDKLGSAIMDSVDLAKDLAEGLGMSFSPEANALIDSMGKSIQLVSAAMAVMNTITIITDMSAKTLMTTLFPLLAIALALAAVFAIVSIGDAKKEKQVKKEQDRVEALQKRYEELQRVIEKGLSIDAFAKSSQLAKNMQDQIDAYEKMIAAESDKKKSDEDKIKGWKEDIADLYNDIEDLYDDLREKIVGSFKDISETLGDAVIAAFAAGENAATQWGKTVNEIVGNILKQMMIQKFLEPAIEKKLDEFYERSMPKTTAAENAAENVNKKREELADMEGMNFKLATKEGRENALKRQRLEKELEEAIAEWERLNAEAAGEVPKITEDASKDLAEGLENAGSDFYKMLPDWMKKYFEEETGGELGGLSKGVSSITEQTADALEALLNSMRFFVADSNLQLKNLYLAFSSGDITSNPMLAELRAQTVQVTAINKLLNSVVGSGHPKGPYGIRVFID